MKKLIGTFAATTLLVASVNVFALPSQPSDCPPVNLVKSHANFDMAQKVMNEMWALADSNQYQFNNQNWLTAFAVTLPGVQSPEEAIAEGKDVFNSQVTLEDAQIMDHYCVYAINPPQFMVVALNDEQQQQRNQFSRFVK